MFTPCAAIIRVTLGWLLGVPQNEQITSLLLRGCWAALSSLQGELERGARELGVRVSDLPDRALFAAADRRERFPGAVKALPLVSEGRSVRSQRSS